MLTNFRSIEHGKDREGEYRIPERDMQKSPKATLKPDTVVYFKRYINRVGYQIDCGSFSKQEWLDAGTDYLVKKCYLPLYLEQKYGKLDGVTSEEISKEVVERIIKQLNLFAPFKGIHRQLYNKLVSPMAELAKSKNIRAMWFKDLENWESAIIHSKVNRKTGKYHHGSSGYDPDDYDPPFLESYNQHLYQIFLDSAGKFVYLYPEDVVTQSEFRYGTAHF